MTAFGGFAKPGQGAAVFDTPREIVSQGFDSSQFVFDSGIIVGTARDAGNSVTTVLRPGLLLGKVTSTGKYIQWDATATDGSQYFAGILWKELRATDFDANNTDRDFTILVGRGVLQASKLLVKGVALTSATDEYLARRMLRAADFVLDDDPLGYKAGNTNLSFRHELQTGTSHSPSASADNGKTFYYSSASAVAVTLPTLVPGLEFTFVRTADEELVVASAAGDDMVVGNDLSADSVTFTTGSQQIGAIIRVTSVYIDASTLKWIVTLPPAPYGTGTATLAYSIAS